MNSWDYKVLSGKRRPRQFEYHPENGSVLFGCMNGEVAIVEDEGTRSIGMFGENESDVVLGLCWFKHSPHRYPFLLLIGTFIIWFSFIYEF